MSNKTNTNGRKRESEKVDLFYPVLIFLSLVAFSIWYNVNAASYITTTNAVVEGKLITINSRVSGPVVHLNVEENQEVKKGDVLIEIDTRDYYERMKYLESKLKETRAELYKQELTGEEEERQRNIPYDSSASLSRYGFSQNDFGKYPTGILPPPPQKDKSVLIADSEKKIQEEKAKAEAIAEKERAEKEAKNPVKKVVNPLDKINEEDIKDTEDETPPRDLKSEIKKLEAQIDQIKLDMSYSKIYAPQDGIVSVINVEEGGYADAGETLMSIIPKQVWVSAIYSDTQLGDIVSGQPVFVKIKKYPRRKFKGVVDCIQHYTYASPRQYAIRGSDEFPDKPQVRIMFIEDYSEFDIQPGTSVSVSIKIN